MRHAERLRSISTDDQILDLQRDALKRAKCRTVYEEQVSGKSTARPEFGRMPKVSPGRRHTCGLAAGPARRELADLVRIIAECEQRKIQFVMAAGGRLFPRKWVRGFIGGVVTPWISVEE